MYALGCAFRVHYILKTCSDNQSYQVFEGAKSWASTESARTLLATHISDFQDLNDDRMPMPNTADFEAMPTLAAYIAKLSKMGKRKLSDKSIAASVKR